jgi:hypothetical protein
MAESAAALADLGQQLAARLVIDGIACTTHDEDRLWRAAKAWDRSTFGQPAKRTVITTL